MRMTVMKSAFQKKAPKWTYYRHNKNLTGAKFKENLVSRLSLMNISEKDGDLTNF